MGVAVRGSEGGSGRGVGDHHVSVHLAGNGATADTAAALYCHRNTVQHRSNRFPELTGDDVRHPESGPYRAGHAGPRSQGRDSGRSFRLEFQGAAP
ncbi:helix-turn-helix domain-containing protein [Streptomyces melanosporofaciens]|uniref:helix-turn-helix domain-containing protein n=1 Tax=Streptomyces melanosporofaciens TaxID=67327 RepID=UPI000AEE1576